MITQNGAFLKERYNLYYPLRPRLMLVDVFGFHAESGEAEVAEVDGGDSAHDVHGSALCEGKGFCQPFLAFLVQVDW